jgi:hypothetical protein
MASRLALPIWFAMFAADRLLSHGWFWLDFEIYRHAATVALEGGNPWLATVAGYRFAGPPPTLLPYLGLALLPDQVAHLLSAAALGAAALAVVRMLRLPLWWLLYPPIVEGLISQNPDIAVIALLLLPGPVAGLGPVLKLYGAIPLLVDRRWSAIAVGVIVAIPSLALMTSFAPASSDVLQVLQRQATGLSAWGTPLAVPTALALLVLRDRGSSWLIVPALWPATQLHYACLALPVLARKPVLAAAFAASIAGLGPAAVIGWAALVLTRRAVRAFAPTRQGAALGSLHDSGPEAPLVLEPTTGAALP